MMIFNLTQHSPTPEQQAKGVTELSQDVCSLLTFETIPSALEIEDRAVKLAEIAANAGCKQAIVGGALYLIGLLEIALLSRRIEPIYSFSNRQSVEEHMPDGSVRKTQVFQHVGWVRPVGSQL